MKVTLKAKTQFIANCSSVLGSTFYVLLLCFACFALNAQDLEVIGQMPKLYFDKDEQGGWVPFKTAAIPGRSGIFIELAQAMQDYSGIQFIPVNLPAKRAEKALKDGLIDFDFVSLEWLKNNRVSDQYLTTNSFFEITEHLITLKKNTHLFPTRESMFCKRVGTIAGYFYFDDNEFIRTDFLNENHLMQGLKYERFKVIILERETAKYWAKINDTKIGFAALHTTGHILLRVRKKHSRLIPLLNKAIEAIKSSGQLESILNKHGVDSRIDYPHSQLNDNTQDVDQQK